MTTQNKLVGKNKLQELLIVIKSYESIIDLDEEGEVMNLMADIQTVMEAI